MTKLYSKLANTSTLDKRTSKEGPNSIPRQTVRQSTIVRQLFVTYMYVCVCQSIMAKGLWGKRTVRKGKRETYMNFQLFLCLLG